MKHRSLLLLGLWGWLIWLVACAPTVSKSEPIVVARPERSWPDELMLVQPDGVMGPGMLYNIGNGRQTATFPPGRLSADKQHYVATSWQDISTLVEIFNPEQGEAVGNFNLDGRWQLGGLSPDGRWLAFVADDKAEQTDGWQTDIAVVSQADGSITNRLQLDGRFEVDAINNEGTGLFLIQYVPPDQPEQYVVRFYDLRLEALHPDPLRDKRSSDEVMTGFAWGTVADNQGHWWHTLYVSTQRNKAFIHALNLQDHLFTICIDLPSGEGDFDTLQQYALALSPNGQTIYATNPALGLVAEVSLETFEVVQQVTFDRVTEKTDATMFSSILSTDGSRLFFTNGRQVWAYDTAAKVVTQPYLLESAAPVQGMAVSEDGERLVVAAAERPLQVFDIVSGEAMTFPGGEVAKRP
jgi:dipeptidyl aminopeptidase/acylaminoacyl peptidase